MLSSTPHALAALTTPDEDPCELEALIAALTAELDPRTHLERRQVELIAYAEWEIARHRRLSAGLLTSETERIRSHVAQVEASSQHISNFRRPNAPPPEPPGPERTGEFAARAYANGLHFHAHHELSTERLEARRRQLLRDLHELQARRERASAADAEVVND
jgi:tetrahydromethanopterin S-methyltransferase subunit F